MQRQTHISLPAYFIERFKRECHIERSRFNESGQRARGLLLGLLPIGVALAMIVQYLGIADRLDRADYYHVLQRTPIDVYLRLLAPALIGGLIATTAATAVFTHMAEAIGSLWRLVATGPIYGLLIPAISAALIPLNLFILGVTELTTVSGQGTLGAQFEDLVLYIPGFTYLSWMVNVGHGIMAGLVLAAVAAVIFRLAGPISNLRKLGSSSL